MRMRTRVLRCQAPTTLLLKQESAVCWPGKQCCLLQSLPEMDISG